MSTPIHVDLCVPRAAATGAAPTNHPGILELLQRIQAEFLEMPGMRLTEEQAQRLWSLDPTVCSALLDALVDARFLCRTSNGAVMHSGMARDPVPAMIGRERSAVHVYRRR
jgi:hypothetical protein